MLVIIGLIVGAIMVGQEMIKAARQRRQLISEIDKISTAVNTFNLKYNCLPGDCPANQAQQAGFTAYCPGTGGRPNYTGDGLIAMTNNQGQDSCEHVMFAYHLYLSNLVQDFAMTSRNPFLGGNNAGLPWPSPQYIISRAYPEAWIVPTSQPGTPIAGNWLLVEGGITSAGEWMTTYYPDTGGTVLSPLAAAAIDGKIDDGLPLTGIVQAVGDTGGHNDSTCEAAGFGGSCIGYGNQGWPNSGSCFTSNTPSANYPNNDNYGGQGNHRLQAGIPGEFLMEHARMIRSSRHGFP